MPKLLIIVTILLNNPCLAQQPVAGMGYMQQLLSAYPTDEASATGCARQPASLGTGKEAGFSFRGQKLIFADAPTEFLLVAVMPVLSGRMALTVDHMQSGDLRQSQVGFGYGLRLSAGIALGIKLSYYQTASSGYPARKALPVELGLTYDVTTKFSTGLSIYNLLQKISSKKYAEQLPMIVSLASCFKFSENIAAVLITGWNGNSSVIIFPALQIRLRDRFSFTIGYGSSLHSWNGSTSFRLKSFSITAGFQWHPALGLSNALELAWNGKSADEK